MAEKYVNKKTEVAYCGEDVLDKLIVELNSRFAYQKVLIFDVYNEYESKFEAIKHNCFVSLVFASKIEDLVDESYACVVVVNVENMGYIKQKCFMFKLPYISILTKAVLPNYFKTKVFNAKSLTKCNPPLAIFLDTSRIADKNSFVVLSNIVLQTLNFNKFDMYSNSLLSSKPICFEENNKICELLARQKELVKEDKIDLRNLVSASAEMLLNTIILSTETDYNVLDFCSHLFLSFNKKNTMEQIFVFYDLHLILLSIYKQFLAYFSTNLCSQINYEIHSKFYEQIGLVYMPKQNNELVEKSCFVLKNFRQDMHNKINTIFEEENVIKNYLSQINSNDFCALDRFNEQLEITNYLCLSVDLFEDDSLLKVLNEKGLLNYNF